MTKYLIILWNNSISLCSNRFKHHMRHWPSIACHKDIYVRLLERSVEEILSHEVHVIKSNNSDPNEITGN